ncbi:O-antigen polymerase [Paludibacter sp. 221]|uniref:O-antigen polymerase n=1 Tax=Paludibacter sp. 221 TaxID=2302939 RepID=UPI0013D2F06A|nr:O-antigen polymerase [Paludibacter sp. 221]
MLLLFNIIFCLSAVLFTIMAPDKYSYNFCLFVVIIFLFQNLIYFLLKKEKGIISFEFFFFISFAATNFIYPIVYYPTNPNYSFFGYYPINDDVISKSTALAYLAYSFYMLGITTIKKRNESLISANNFIFTEKSQKRLFLLFLLFFVSYAATGGIAALRDVYSGDGNIKEIELYSYFKILFIACAYLSAMFVLRHKNQLRLSVPLIFLGLVCLILLSTGTRGSVISIILILIVAYNQYIKKISLIKASVLVFFGAFILTMITFLRTQNIFEQSWVNNTDNVEIESVFDLFFDLVINNRNLYALVDFSDTFSHTYFVSMLSDFLSIIPGLFGYVANNINVPIELITSGELPTYLELGTGSTFGLGTNLVGEAYLTFSYPGVIVFFFLIGFIIKYTRTKADSNIYAYVIYYLFVGYSVSYPRLPIIFNSRFIVWSLFIVWGLYKFQQIEMNKKTKYDLNVSKDSEQ